MYVDREPDPGCRLSEQQQPLIRVRMDCSGHTENYTRSSQEFFQRPKYRPIRACAEAEAHGYPQRNTTAQLYGGTLT